jgi:hypothetical protein
MAEGSVMGAVVILVMGLYLLISIGVVKAAIAYARKNGKRVWAWGWGAALVMYLIPFWDWIPTVVMHRYYCATEAGFWIYKTPEQWIKENPGVISGLRPILSIQQIAEGERYVLDQRFCIDTVRQIPVPGLSTRIVNRSLIDQVTGEVLAREIGVGSGDRPMATGGSYKFWLRMTPCNADGIASLTRKIEQLRNTQ